MDNAWSAPGAHGCGGFFLEGLIDPAINAALGLPSAAGHNTAILNGKLEDRFGRSRESERIES